jgi:phospho-N-acetylmuramoyl-pentapeptide-transferase
MGMIWCVLLSWFLVGLYSGLARRRGWGQTVRQDGPASHLVKSGTPNMGGVPLLLAVLSMWLIAKISGHGGDVRETILMLSILGMGAIGFLDDFVKVRDRMAGKASDGLYARYKLALQLLVGVAFGFSAAKYMPLALPGWGLLFDGTLYTLIIIAAVNAFNFTDGLDGLLGGVTLIILLPLMGLSPIVSLMIGAIVGFMWYNVRPASVFMGDAGSFGMGAAAAAGYILYGKTWQFPVAAGIPIIEVLSVFIQVAYFRRTGGKRIFLMTPIHHHFEKLGMPEEKVTGRFWMITALCTALAWLLMGGGSAT